MAQIPTGKKIRGHAEHLDKLSMKIRFFSDYINYNGIQNPEKIKRKRTKFEKKCAKDRNSITKKVNPIFVIKK